MEYIERIFYRKINPSDFKKLYDIDRPEGGGGQTYLEAAGISNEKIVDFLSYAEVSDSPLKDNVKNAKRYSRFAVDENAIPVTPHLLYPQFMDDGNEAERDMAMHFNYVLLGKCTEVWVFGGVISRGMAREIGVAKKRRMKIRWFTQDLKEVGEYD